MPKPQISKESAILLKELRENKLIIKTPDNKDFVVPKEGNLGLLALGYRGLIAWRQTKHQK